VEQRFVSRVYLTTMNKEKNIDAVQMMRNIREKLSKKYWKHPDILKKEMEAIRQKYHLSISSPN
jgi:hypothetical protein